jgi:hypothetical protein
VGAFEWYEASARNGTGVFETLKGISKLTLRSLRTKMTGEARRPMPSMAPSRGSVVPPPAAPGTPSAGTVFPDAPPTPAPELPTEPSPSAGAVLPAGGPSELSFSQSNAQPSMVSEDGEVKRVRVRSTVDILSELDKLRKLATQTPASPSDAFPAVEPAAGRIPAPRQPSLSIEDLLSPGVSSRRDVSRSFDLSIARAALSHTQKVTVTLRFNGGPGGQSAETEREVTVNLPASRDLRRLLLSLKFNVQSE